VTGWRRWFGRWTPAPAPPASATGPLRPVIRRDYCTGCNACVAACDNDCLALEWDFATLVRPDDCDGEGNCRRACPEGLITMQRSAV
jgi:NAD-dependent dihydropyrimidine dehydrogenase PreA subunit